MKKREPTKFIKNLTEVTREEEERMLTPKAFAGGVLFIGNIGVRFIDPKDLGEEGVIDLKDIND